MRRLRKLTSRSLIGLKSSDCIAEEDCDIDVIREAPSEFFRLFTPKAVQKTTHQARVAITASVKWERCGIVRPPTGTI
jgi:hypothetical protein